MTCWARCRKMVLISCQVKGWAVTGLRWLTRAARLGVRQQQHDAEPARGSSLGSRRLYGNLRVVLTRFCTPEMGAAPDFHSLCCHPDSAMSAVADALSVILFQVRGIKGCPRPLALFSRQSKHMPTPKAEGNHWSNAIIKHVHEGLLSLRASLCVSVSRCDLSLLSPSPSPSPSATRLMLTFVTIAARLKLEWKTMMIVAFVAVAASYMQSSSGKPSSGKPKTEQKRSVTWPPPEQNQKRWMKKMRCVGSRKEMTCDQRAQDLVDDRQRHVSWSGSGRRQC